MIEIDPEAKAGIRILIVDDDRTLRESCRTYLETEGYRVEIIGRGTEAAALLARQSFDIALLDLYMADVGGSELLRICLKKNPDCLAIMATGNPSVESSVETLRAGAWDYLTKPFTATQLQILIGRAVHSIIVAREAKSRRSGARGPGADAVTPLGMSSAFREAIALARKVARTDASVLINGESGTGKELIAQFIHQNSRRATRPLVEVNCAALPETLLESEMFGHRKGAFTGAVRDKPGLLEMAHGGTMLLDEMTEMSTPIQAKLLRVIQDGVVRRVGSENVDAVVNVRFIAATNRDPAEAVASGRLRGDLYYRLRVVPITVPPLRERTEDIPVLANHFLEHYWVRHRDQGTPPPRLSEGALRTLKAQAWPGNVRELQNVIEHLVVLAEPGSRIRPEQLPFEPVEAEAAPREVVSSSPLGALENQPFDHAREAVLAEFELRYLTALVRRAEGNMSRAARLATMDRTTLYRLMDKHGLSRDSLMSDVAGDVLSAAPDDLETAGEQPAEASR